jgi:L-cysteate sulfo-lyase
MSFNTPLDFSRFPRFTLLDGPTPIQRLHRLEAALGKSLNGVRLFVKRDDHMSVGGGGNKLRKLEFLIGAAQSEQADTVVTVGGLQSNHARLTAAAAARAGLACELVLGRPVPRDDDDYELNGNMLLNPLFGAAVHVLPAGEDTYAAAQARAAQLRTQGKRVYLAPIGGSTPTGALGYAACAQEILQQAQQMNLAFSRVVVPNGSSGTQAGLVAGFVAAGDSAPAVRGFTTLAPTDDARRTTHQLAQATLAMLGVERPVHDDEIDVDGAFRGTGYGIPTDAMIEAVTLLARTEGLLLDPVYSGKAFAGMLADVRAQRYAAGENVLFVMTGGTPGLYAYRSVFGARPAA